MDLFNLIEQDGGEVLTYDLQPEFVEELRLGSHATDDLLQRIAQDGRFKKLLQLVTYEAKLTDACCEFVASFKFITHLQLDDSLITDHGMAELLSMPALVSLRLDSCRGITGRQLELRGLSASHLKELVLSRTGITGTTLATILQHCSALTHVYVQLTPVDAAVIEAINAHPALRYLNIIQTPLGEDIHRLRSDIFIDV